MLHLTKIFGWIFIIFSSWTIRVLAIYFKSQQLNENKRNYRQIQNTTKRICKKMENEKFEKKGLKTTIDKKFYKNDKKKSTKYTNKRRKWLLDSSKYTSSDNYFLHTKKNTKSYFLRLFVNRGVGMSWMKNMMTQERLSNRSSILKQMLCQKVKSF